MNYQPTIGLEVHIELKTCSKMFCSCPNDPLEKRPNINICPVCLGHPGVLPVINKEAVKKVIKTGLALNCKIPEYSKFDRKNYFYPDLPKNYQISQLYMPLCKEGFLEIGEGPEKKQAFYGVKKTRIREIHLEEDTGKLIHPPGADYSLVDFNRAGIPLMELVTEPDLKTGREARKFAQELQLILRYLGVSEADMEKGQMRVEVNISLQPENPKVPLIHTAKTQNPKLGTKVEIKNLNSFRAVEGAVKYEIIRQEKLLKLGKKVTQETRGWDADKEITKSQRTKEEAYDYRYFPEPDLPPLHLGLPWYLHEIKAEIPELPALRRERFKQEYQLGEKEIEAFVQNKELGEYFEKVATELRNWVKEAEIKKEVKESDFLKLAKLASNYILTDLQGLMKAVAVVHGKLLITPENFAEFLTLIYKKEISSKIAKIVLQEMLATGADPSHIIEDKGLSQITDESEIEGVAKEVIFKNQKAAADYKKGKETALQFLIGQVMQKTQGKASPDLVNKILRKFL